MYGSYSIYFASQIKILCVMSETATCLKNLKESIYMDEHKSQKESHAG
jgi:hypothetical protein